MCEKDQRQIARDVTLSSQRRQDVVGRVGNAGVHEDGALAK
jgi:hypothetical protein